MKKQFIIVSALLSVGLGYSQNVFPTASGTNVGIGTTTPSERLEVIGNVKATTGIFTKSPGNGANYSGDYRLRAIESNVLSAGTLLDPDWNYRTFQFWDFPQSDLDPTPLITLNLEDRNYKSRFTFLAAADSYSQFLLRDKSQQDLFRIVEDGSDRVFLELAKTNSKVIIGGTAEDTNGIGHKLYVKAGSARIEGNILTDANVGIGTNIFIDGTDNYRLSVNGAVRAHRVKVYTTWADFVFDDNYKLPTLKEVENHIKKNGHLKDIPSAKQVEENGIELGEMNKLLLQKVEELTLYLIEMDKEIKGLKQELKSKE